MIGPQANDCHMQSLLSLLENSSQNLVQLHSKSFFIVCLVYNPHSVFVIVINKLHFTKLIHRMEGTTENYAVIPDGNRILDPFDAKLHNPFSEERKSYGKTQVILIEICHVSSLLLVD